MRHEDFLSEIIANPKDDTPRLIYADWLEESGEELNIARQNKVDGFIAKPYNKKQILDCIEKCTLKTRMKGISRGSAGRLR